MNYREELQAAVEAVATNPKVTMGVSAATASLGVASAAEIISGVLSGLAILAGIIATTLLARVHWALYKNHVLQNKILRQQFIELGGNPDEIEP